MSSPFRLRSLLRRLRSEPPGGALSLAEYPLEQVPDGPPLLLKKGDRLAICGDSITEQCLYPLLIETYLTICRPELAINVRHYGWSGEKSGEFLERMDADVLRFHPTVATTLYGMNDFLYIPYDEATAGVYRGNHAGIIRKFKKANCRMLIGSPTIIDAVPDWVKSARGSKYDLNLALCRFRNLLYQLTNEEGVAFADIYLPMLEADFEAKATYGPKFKVAGVDGVHPDWAGQVIIAYVFLKRLGMNGDLGTFSWDLASGKVSAPAGHEVISSHSNHLRLRSSRLPFSTGPGPEKDSTAIQAGLALVPFHDELNRFTFRIFSAAADFYDVTWGKETRRYSAKELLAGINLARDYQNHPLVPAFKRVWDAVAIKQAFETRQYKKLLAKSSSPADRESTLEITEATRQRYHHAIDAAFHPVDHEIIVTAV